MVGQSVRRLCTNCEKETVFESALKEQTVQVRKEPIKIVVQVHSCTECGDEVFDPSLSQDPFVQAYEEYRKRHGLLRPAEIVSWRDSLDLAQSDVAKLLGIGTATLSRYENGALQEEAHDKLLRFAMQPLNLLKLVEESGELPQHKKEKLLLSLRDVRAQSCSLDNAIVLNLADFRPSEFSGFKELDISKLYNLILFFCKRPVLKTKLNKLLFYADFSHFKEYSLPITGVRYAHVPFGPAPDNYEMYFAALGAQKAIELEETHLPGGYVGESLKAQRSPDLSLYTDSELRIMASVAERFDKHTASEMTKLSHEEAGYIETINGRLISYAYASQLKH